MTQSTLLEVFQSRLKGASFPCLVQHSYEEETILSAASLWSSALTRRHVMRSQGMKPGDIWVQEKGGLEAFIHFFACLQGGFIFCPLSLRDHGQTSSVTRGLWKEGCDGQLVRSEALLAPELAGTLSFALLLHTSGTTRGQPRCVRLNDEGIRHQLKTHAEVMGIEAETKRWLQLPWFHSFGLILDGLLGLYAGQHLYMITEPALHPRAMFNRLHHYEIEWLAAVPRSLQLLLQYAETHPEVLPVLKKLHVHSGGAYLTEAKRQQLTQLLASFHWGYGLTECGPGVLMNGRPVGCEVRIMPHPSHGWQELWVRSPSVGQWSGQSESISEGWIPTGDLAFEDASGSFDVIGRTQDCFKNSSGQWIHLREIEQSLEQTLPLMGVHVSLQGDASQFIARIVTNDRASDLPVGLLQKLEKLLPLPFQIWIGQPSEALLQSLQNIPQKSLNEAIGRLPPEAFLVIHRAAA
ncbi:MAG TPA: AMP-binding protein [Oligoflexus sp.]|uniref:class I adenylate-forming enzyme family protein n=1 Tax=Oligoflexus sp. TaxID=1971216 RepID=UPI002D7FD418|nr:AMP-binding protein [Oligoflexus sp.]HET9237750.1 AMP-binding protein [Oligoflexus sp.]